MKNYLTHHSNFQTLAELDLATSQHLQKNYNNLNKTDKDVLNMIKCYSVKYGSAHLKHETMQTTLKKSNSTIRRSLVKLEKLKIIERIKTIRKVRAGYGANIYAILPFDEQSNMDSRQQSTNVDTTTKTQAISEEKHYSFNNNKKCSCQHDTYSHDSPITFYQRFKALLSNTIGQANKQASKLYGVYRSQSIKLMRFDYLKQEKELFEDLAIQALKITTQAVKRKYIKNLSGYYSGVLKNLIDKALFGDDYFKEMEDLAVF